MSFIKNFMLRGFTSAWAGPVVLVIVYFCLSRANVVSAVEVGELFRAVISSVIMSFIAGGIGALYKSERLPIAMAAIIHLVVLYLDYLAFYLINGYLLSSHIWIFTLIFLGGFAIIWLIIYFFVYRRNVNRLNKKISGQ